MNFALYYFVMVLASYRLTRLVTKDTFPPILWLRDRLAGGWREATQSELDNGIKDIKTFDGEPNIYVQRVRWSPQWLADLISCAWCSSGWVTLAVTAVVWTMISMPMAMIVLVWFAVWAAAALLASQDWA